jgi:hypothetical protein
MKNGSSPIRLDNLFEGSDRGKPALDVSTWYSVSRAITRLQILLEMPTDVKEALLMFWQRQEQGLFLYLYRKYFPDDYRLSQESEEINPAWNYSPREVEFFYLALDHLLPLLDVDYISQVGAEGERASDIIPVLPYQMPWWAEFEQLSLGWQYLRLLSGTLTPDEAIEAMSAFNGLPEDLKTSLLVAGCAMSAASPTEQARVRRFFCAQQSPYAGFGQVLALYQCQTGIAWLDALPDEGGLYEDYCWCETHFEALIQEYQAAQRYEEEVNTFATWLVRDGDRLRHLLALIWTGKSDSSVAPAAGR